MHINDNQGRSTKIVNFINLVAVVLVPRRDHIGHKVIMNYLLFYPIHRTLITLVLGDYNAASLLICIYSMMGLLLCKYKPY